MFKCLYIIPLLFLGIVANAQTTEESIADYEQQIENATTDSAKVRLLCEMSLAQRQVDLEAAKKTTQKALDLAISINDRISIASAIGSVCSISNLQGEYDKTIANARQAIEILDADTTIFSNNSYHENLRLGHLYTSTGMAYDYKSEYTTAIQNHLKAQEAYKAANDPTGISVTYNNLGISYIYLGDMEKSAENFNYGYEKMLADGDPNAAYQLKLNIGIIAFNQQNYEEAKQIFLECAANFEKLEKLRSLSNTYSNLSLVFGELGQVDSALFYIKKAVKLDEEFGDPQSILTSKIMLGTAYLRFKMFNEADEKYNEALEMSLELGQMHDIELAYNKLAFLEQERGDWKASLEYYIKAEKYGDSIQLDNNNRELGKIEAEHEFNKSLAVQEAENEQKLKIEEEKRRQQSLILYFTIGIIVVIMFFIYMLIKSLRQTRKAKEEVEEARLEIEMKNQEMVDSITYAKRIQNAILPPEKEIKRLLPKSFVLYKPKDIVAGDFYWLEEKNDAVLFAAADCTGHGVPGAMVSVVCNNGLNRAVREFGLSDPGHILDKTRELVIKEFEKSEEDVKDGMDIALCSLNGNTLRYAGAHNPLWIIRNGSDEIEEIKATKQPIGKFDNPQSYNSQQVQLNPGDQFYIFSDGFADQFGGEKGKKFKAANFKKLLQSVANMNIEEQKSEIDRVFEDWKSGLEQLDDVCIIGVRV